MATRERNSIDTLVKEINNVNNLIPSDVGYLVYQDVNGFGAKKIYAVCNDAGGLTACFNGTTPKATAYILRKHLEDLKAKQGY